MKVLRIFCS